ncbi:hypothetical protein GCO27_03705 [Corynebacterium sp. zg331]|nr:hypothetical protein [Corynebacterium sp. zg331]
MPGVGDVPVFKGYASRAYFEGESPEVTRALRKVNYRALARRAAVAFLVGLVAMQLLPVVDRALDWALGLLDPRVSDVGIDAPKGRWGMIKEALYHRFPALRIWSTPPRIGFS